LGYNPLNNWHEPDFFSSSKLIQIGGLDTDMKLITPTCSIHHPFSIRLRRHFDDARGPRFSAAPGLGLVKRLEYLTAMKITLTQIMAELCSDYIIYIYIYMYSVYIYMHMHLIEMNQKIQNMTELQYVFSFWHWQDLGYCSYAQSPCHFPGAPMEADAGLW